MQWNRCSEQHGIFLVPHPTIPFTLSHLEGTMSRMSSHHAKNKINVSAPFVDTLNWSLFVQQKEAMWGLVNACALRSFTWLRKEGRRENVNYIEQLINVMVVRLDLDPYRNQLVPCSAVLMCVATFYHQVQCQITTSCWNRFGFTYLWKNFCYVFSRVFQFVVFINFYFFLPWIFLFCSNKYTVCGCLSVYSVVVL